jgi:hypothetical protein
MGSSGVNTLLTTVLWPVYQSIALRFTSCVSRPVGAPKTLIPGGLL